MADTITATINSITTLALSAEISAATMSTTSNVPSTYVPPTSLELTYFPPAISTPVVPNPTLGTIATSPSAQVETPAVSSPSPITSSSVSISSIRSEQTSASSVNGLITSTSTSQSSAATRSRSLTTSSATASATAAAATEKPQKADLPTTAIAGIVTASVVVVALAIGYLTYLWIVRRKEKEKRRSRRLSTRLPPTTRNDMAGSAPPAAAKIPLPPRPAPEQRFYSGEPAQEKRKSFWRKSYVPPSDIGVAVAASTRISPAQGQRPWPASAYTPQHVKPAPLTEANRWSVATSFDEDIEAQPQDVPILGSPKNGSSARSFSSIAVEKPAPLPLSKIKPKAVSPSTPNIALTPKYDNGTFEPTIRQVIETVALPAALVPQSGSQPALNFSRRVPSITWSPQDDSVPFWPQNRRPVERFPVKPSPQARPKTRKQSETSYQSISVYTEIEEDDTPENEVDKQLEMPASELMAATGERSSLRNLQWPQIPRPAALAKQATKPHSPRAPMTIRRVDPFTDAGNPFTTSHSNAPMSTSARVGGSVEAKMSSTNMQFHSQASPVFPMPPRRKHQVALTQDDLARQIGDAYRAASRTMTATSVTPTKNKIVSYYDYSENIPLPSPAAPGAVYQQIQRLSTGRPLAQKWTELGYKPRPQQTQIQFPTRTTSRVLHNSGDLYFRVD